MKLKKLTLFFLLANIASLSQANIRDDIAPPNVKIIDSLGVNMATGQVNQSVDTVSIGGERGLSHKITPHANFLDAKRGFGYHDKFSGAARYKKLSESEGVLTKNKNGLVSYRLLDGSTKAGNIRAMRVSGPEGSQDFAVEVNGTLKNNATGINTNFSYIAIGDKRHQLFPKVEDGTRYLVWRTPEGIESYYSPSKPSGSASVGGRLQRVEYPSGYTLYMNFGAVWNNAGFMLKFDAPETGSEPGYWNYNPKSISAINLTVDYCSKELAVHPSDCNINNWPTAYFQWPDGMPDIMYINNDEDKIFSVTNQFGGLTEFHYETQNVCLFTTVDSSGESPECVSKFKGNEKYAPRLTGVKSEGSNQVDITYFYRNDGSFVTFDSALFSGIRISSWYWDLSSKNGRVIKATDKNKERGYRKPISTDKYNYAMYRESAGNRVEVYNYHPGKLEYVRLRRSGVYDFEYNSRNFVVSHRPLAGQGPLKKYIYDDEQGGRGNLARIESQGIVIQEADYPETCNDKNYKFCNKPMWIKDAKGQQTDFTYHKESGQIESVTGPAVNVNSGAMIRPKTIYKYDDLYAYYKKYNNSIVKADSPIWLLTEEHTCRTSKTTDSGCKAGDSDMVKTNYYYGPQQDGTPNNLFMRGKSVTAEGDSGKVETRVWCYAYDKLGNLIKENSPKNNISLQSCP